jgi:hypothetical protein
MYLRCDVVPSTTDGPVTQNCMCVRARARARVCVQLPYNTTVVDWVIVLSTVRKFSWEKLIHALHPPSKKKRKKKEKKLYRTRQSIIKLVTVIV